MHPAQACTYAIASVAPQGARRVTREHIVLGVCRTNPVVAHTIAQLSSAMRRVHETAAVMFPESMVDEQGRRMRVEMRTGDDFCDATLMCLSSDVAWNAYHRSKAFADALAGLETTTQEAEENRFVKYETGADGKRHTWVCPELAIDLARWISPRFGTWMTRLVLRRIRTKVTTEESRAPAGMAGGSANPAGGPGLLADIRQIIRREIDEVLRDSIQMREMETPELAPSLHKEMAEELCNLVAGAVEDYRSKTRGLMPEPGDRLPDKAVGRKKRKRDPSAKGETGGQQPASLLELGKPVEWYMEGVQKWLVAYMSKDGGPEPSWQSELVGCTVKAFANTMQKMVGMRLWSELDKTWTFEVDRVVGTDTSKYLELTDAFRHARWMVVSVAPPRPESAMCPALCFLDH